MRKLLAAMLCAAAACGGSGDKKNDQQTVATPAFTPAGGTYAAPQTVTITCATAGATIRYTTDGTTPTASSPAYATPVAISTTGTVLKAMATLTGYTDSAVATATYVLQAATPTFSPAAGTYAVPQSVVLATATPGAAIHYTTDGTTPTGSSPPYSAPVSVTTVAPTTIKAIATRSGFADSAVASGTYVINAEATPAATPTFSPVAGTYTSAQNVTISCATAGATIYYTTDGADPTTGSTVFTTPVVVSSSKTLKAIAVAPGFTQSAVGSAAYTINLPQPVATPTFSPTPGTYTSAQNVTITCATAGATIYYTTSGVDPTTSSTVYSAAVPISTTTTLKAMAAKAGLTDSAVASGLYTISTGAGFDNLCQAVQTKLQNLLATCLRWNPALFTAGGPFGDQASLNCAEIRRHIARVPALITYDPIQGAACVADVEALGCAVLDAGGGVPLPGSCQAALLGQVAGGGTCYSDEDCAAGYCTADWTSACPGTCQPYPALGGTCSPTIPCGPGHDCRYPTPSSLSGTCRVPQALNGDCPCQAGFWCDDSAGPPGVCKALQTSGACDPASFQCAVGYECGPIGPTATCRPLVGGGGDCTADPRLCGTGYRCSAGTCVSWPAVGAVCDIFTSLCIGGYCDFSTAQPWHCADFKVPGATCTTDVECASFSCTGGTCDATFCAMP